LTAIVYNTFPGVVKSFWNRTGGMAVRNRSSHVVQAASSRLQGVLPNPEKPAALTDVPRTCNAPMLCHIPPREWA